MPDTTRGEYTRVALIGVDLPFGDVFGLVWKFTWASIIVALILSIPFTILAMFVIAAIES